LLSLNHGGYTGWSTPIVRLPGETVCNTSGVQPAIAPAPTVETGFPVLTPPPELELPQPATVTPTVTSAASETAPRFTNPTPNLEELW
jgi:hypothetical protein